MQTFPPAIEELPEYRITASVMDRRDFLLLRGSDAQGVSRLVQVFKRLDPGSNAFARLKVASQRIREAAGDGILRILEIRADRGRVCLIREDFAGLPLDQFLQAQALDLPDRLRLALDIVAVLERIHRGEMAHLALLPDNILVDPDDFRVKIWNCFGETLDVNPNSLGGEAERILPFRAPEQFGRLNRAVDHRTDLYACGILFYLILARRLPYQARSAEDWAYSHLARTPLPPETWDPSIPPVLSQMVLRLLAKDPDDRYQTSYGLLLDLKDCREQLEESGRIQVRSQPKNARRGEFILPQRLYGREQELAALRAAWEGLGDGLPGVVLVSGAAGMGKSGLIHEWGSSLPSGALLARGKFELADQGIPFSAWRRALADLVDQLMAGTAASIAALHSAAREFLGPSRTLLRELLPELAASLGPDPGSDSAAEQAMPRLLAGLERFLSAVPENHRGLAVLLDDMQWADEASLKLFGNLAASPSLPGLLLVGACREAGSAAEETPDGLWLRAGRPGGERLRRIRLGPLSKATFQEFISDALGIEPSRSASLAGLVHMKSHGNPFHMREILTYLHRERILRHEPAGGWKWDLGSLAKVEDAFTLNNLVAERWTRMSAWEREVLQLAACAGTGPLLDDLMLATGLKREDLFEALQGPVRLGFIRPAAGDFRFSHDRLWEAIYFQLPESQRRRLHARIARALMRSGTQDAFKIVRHLQCGDPVAGTGEERLRFGRIHLEAARLSMASVSSGAALELFTAGLESAGPDAWDLDHGLAMDLHLGCLEAACLQGDADLVGRIFREIEGHCRDDLELARAYAARMTALGEANALEGAVASLREGLALLGSGLPRDKEGVEEAIREELARAARLKRGRSPKDFAAAAPITDRSFLAATDLLARSAMVLFYSDQDLLTLVQLKMVNLILEHGNTVQSPFAYLAYGWIQAAEGEDFASAYAFGRLAVESVDGRSGAFRGCLLEEIHASMIQHWVRPFRECAGALQHAFQLGRESGDLHYALLGQLNRLGMLLIAGENLGRLEEEFLSHAPLFARMGGAYPGFLFRLRRRHVRRLRHGPETAAGDPEDDGPPDSSALEAGNQLAHFNHHHSGEILAFLEGDFARARRHSLAAEGYLGRANALPAVAEHAFFSALILAALAGCQGGAAPDEAEELGRYCGRLDRWARSCPANYRARALLAGAERLRTEGRAREAESLCLDAVREAGEQGQVQIVALGFETAGRLHHGLGNAMASEACFAQAAEAYADWGASAKAASISAAHLHSRSPRRPAPIPPPSLGLPEGGGRNESLFQVLKAARALSAEVSPEPLLRKLMETLMEVSAARKGCLLLREKGILVLAAESGSGEETCMLRREEAEAPEALAWSAARFADRNGKPLVLEAAHGEALFREDARIRSAQVRSLLCLPIFAEGGDRGILYLENNFPAGAFTPDRLELLELIASLAAICLRNAGLYEQTRNLAAHLQSARESERKEVAREVHDELGHALTALHLDLSWLALKGPREDPAFLEKVGAMSSLVEATVQSVQRIISELRPAVLDQLGLCEALEWQVRELGKRSDILCHLDLPERNPALSQEAATAVFRILQEGISNILRHAEARQVWIRLSEERRGKGTEVRLEIRDDGKGVTPAQVRHPLSFGLAGMRERLRPWNGRLRVESEQGRGTLVEAVLPMDPKESVP